MRGLWEKTQALATTNNYFGLGDYVCEHVRPTLKGGHMHELDEAFCSESFSMWYLVNMSHVLGIGRDAGLR